MKQYEITTCVGQLAVYDSHPQQIDNQKSTVVLWPSILTSHKIFESQVNELSNRHRLILIDGPGHGESHGAPEMFSIKMCAQATVQILDQLSINNPIYFLGVSWGGLVACELALLAPERTRGLVLCNTPVFEHHPTFADYFVTWGARWIHRTSMYINGAKKAFFLPETIENNKPAMLTFEKNLIEADGKSLSLSAQSVLINRNQIFQRIHEIITPVLFIAGSHDSSCPLEKLEDVVTQFTCLQFEIVKSGHISVVDAPTESNQLIERFLATH
jgi:pimeloyl-ACP methyl ester carboxylesterase